MPEDMDIGIEPSAHMTILYTGDLHGNVEKMAYISTVISEKRAGQAPLILVDSGDWSSGSPLCDNHQGKPMAEIMEYLCYDAVCLGEGDLSRGLLALSDLRVMVSFPFLCSNVRGDIPPEIKAHTIKEIAGLKVALIGVSTMANLPERHCYMVAPEEGVADSLRALEKESPDLLVLLSHLGIEKDREMARLFPSLQVIIGGHSHVITEKPLEVGNTLIVHAGAHGDYLGSLSLDVGAKVTIRYGTT
jgi:5'-nucleotidase